MIFILCYHKYYLIHIFILPQIDRYNSQFKFLENLHGDISYKTHVFYNFYYLFIMYRV